LKRDISYIAAVKRDERPKALPTKPRAQFARV